MKKCALALSLAIVLLAILASAGINQIPAPFEKAKEMALRTPKDINGNHIVTLTYNENGTEIVFIIAYIPADRIIAVGSTIDGMVYEYWEKDGRVTVYVLGIGRFSIDDKYRVKFFDEAFRIFRSLVCRHLI